MNVEIYDCPLPNDTGTPDTGELLILPWYSAQENREQGKAVYPESTSTVLKLLRKNSIEVRLSEGDLSAVVFEDRHSIEWFGPIIFFSAAAIANNPEIITITLNIISNYLSDILFGDKVTKDEPIANFHVVLQDKEGAKEIKYEGPVSGISDIENVIKAIKNDSKGIA
ncbi:hypothetical protein LJC22_05145 [Desulfosarcina sp. OttesenSCG-928-G10]|nr:hypothetical protein [Desulfosarcina sp. OttesenSCG-928-G10]